MPGLSFLAENSGGRNARGKLFWGKPWRSLCQAIAFDEKAQVVSMLGFSF